MIHENGRRPRARLGLTKTIVGIRSVHAAGRYFDASPLRIEATAEGVVAVNEGVRGLNGPRVVDSVAARAGGRGVCELYDAARAHVAKFDKYPEIPPK